VLVLDEGEVLEVVLEEVPLLLVVLDEGRVLLLDVEVVVPVVLFEAGPELTKVGILVDALPVGVMVLPL
jgi:hypothetical protein